MDESGISLSALTQAINALAQSPEATTIRGEITQWVAERIRIFRYASVAKALTGANRKLEEKGITVKNLDLKHISPILEGTSLEAPESELIEWWQGLLESALTDETMTYGYAEVLRQLNALDAKLLSIVRRLEDEPSPSTFYRWNAWQVIEIAKTEAIEDENRLRISMANLKRLGLISFVDINMLPKPAVGPIGLTAYGFDFWMRVGGVSGLNKEKT